jgi:hypothetical protein
MDLQILGGKTTTCFVSGGSRIKTEYKLAGPLINGARASYEVTFTPDHHYNCLFSFQFSGAV